MSNLPLKPRLFVSHRPAASKHVQPLCSQFCSQDPSTMYSEMAYLITTRFPLASESDAWESGERVA